MAIELIIFIGIIFYALIYLSLLLITGPGAFKNLNRKDSSSDKLLHFSIIVAAKNEENNISNLVSALKNLNYPKNNYEVIIVDDSSNDDTFHLAKKLTNELGNFTVISAINKKYEKKRGALDYGISLAKYPNIAITDADCVTETNWLLCLSTEFSAGCDFVFGIAPFYQTNKLVNKVSCYENFRNSLLAISAANFGTAYTASARNFGFKKDAFEKIGGYKNTTETISGDDDLLLREAVKKGLKVCTLTSPGSYVYSDTKKTFKEYFSQRARHTQTSFHYPFKQKLFLALWHLMNLTFVFSPAFVFINRIFILPFLIKIIFDTATAIIYQRKFGYRLLIFEVIYLQLIYEIFLIVHFIKAKIGKIEWK
jgi:cellulose synthase/poly-beta-1,6-N-acetylglucosamine synthase-like glycosyltransferase